MPIKAFIWGIIVDSIHSSSVPEKYFFKKSL